MTDGFLSVRFVTPYNDEIDTMRALCVPRVGDVVVFYFWPVKQNPDQFHEDYRKRAEHWHGKSAKVSLVIHELQQSGGDSYRMPRVSCVVEEA